jgi:hypothetical protein
MQALTSAGGTNSGDGAVTSLDVSPALGMLVAGFYSGRVVLFDVSAAAAGKVTVLKASELHRAPVSVVRFVSASEPSVLSVRGRVSQGGGCLRERGVSGEERRGAGDQTQALFCHWRPSI